MKRSPRSTRPGHWGSRLTRVLKTVSLDTASGHALAVIPASRRLQMTLVRRAVGDPHVSLATEDELEHDFPEFELGSLPPLGSLLHVTIYVDTEVVAHDTVVFAAGKQSQSIKIRTEDLFRGEEVTVVPLTRHSGSALEDSVE